MKWSSYDEAADIMKYLAGMSAMSDEEMARRMMDEAHTAWLRKGMDEIQLPAKKPTLMQRISKWFKEWRQGYTQADYERAIAKLKGKHEQGAFVELTHREMKAYLDN